MATISFFAAQLFRKPNLVNTLPPPKRGGLDNYQKDDTWTFYLFNLAIDSAPSASRLPYP